MSIHLLSSTHIAALNGPPNKPIQNSSEHADAELFLLENRFMRAMDLDESWPPRRRRTLHEELDKVEREIEMYIQVDGFEKARFNQESYLWTAEDRIEWQETQIGNAQRLNELLDQRNALQEQVRTQAVSSVPANTQLREARMDNIKEAFLRAVPQMLFFTGYAAVFLLAVHLYVSLVGTHDSDAEKAGRSLSFAADRTASDFRGGP